MDGYMQATYCMNDRQAMSCMSSVAGGHLHDLEADVALGHPRDPGDFRGVLPNELGKKKIRDRARG